MQQVTGASRRLAIWGAVLAAAIVPSTAFAGGGGDGAKGDGDNEGRHGRQHGNGEGLSVAGRAMSRAEHAGSAIQIKAHRADETDESGGWVRFGQRTAEGGMALEGEVTCLLRGDDGVVQVTGTVRRGGTRAHGEKKGGDDPSAQPSDDPQTMLDGLLGGAEPQSPGGGTDSGTEDGRGKRRGGGELAGKDFAFTIDVPGDPQHFSAPTLGDAGTLPACSAGEGTLEVTRGGFRTTQTEGSSASHSHGHGR